MFFLAVPISKGYLFVLTGRQSGGRDHLRAQAVHLRHGHRAADGNQRRANTGKDLLVLNVRNEVFQKIKSVFNLPNYFFLNCPKLVRMERYSRERKETFSSDSNLILCPNPREELIYKKFVGCTLLEFSAHLKNILES